MIKNTKLFKEVQKLTEKKVQTLFYTVLGNCLLNTGNRKKTEKEESPKITTILSASWHYRQERYIFLETQEKADKVSRNEKLKPGMIVKKKKKKSHCKGNF